METDNQQCCLFCCVSIVFYLLFCLIYGSLYNEGVLQIHGCWEPLLFRVASTHFTPRSSPSLFIISFIVYSLLCHEINKKKQKQSVCFKLLLSLLVITWSPLSLVQVEVSVCTKSFLNLNLAQLARSLVSSGLNESYTHAPSAWMTLRFAVISLLFSVNISASSRSRCRQHTPSHKSDGQKKKRSCDTLCAQAVPRQMTLEGGIRVSQFTV